MTKRFIKLSGVYAIINIANDKCYIGSAVNLRKRWEFHKWQLMGNKHNNSHLQKSWNKHRSNSFIFVVVEYVEKEYLITREQFWMDNLKPKYNICPVAASMQGRPVSAETRAKISASQIGKIIPLEQREKIAAAKRGLLLSEETKRKLSIVGKGKNGKYKRSNETLEKLRQIRLGKTLSEATKAKIGAKSALRVVSEKEKIDKRKFDKWPCAEGSRCKCIECNAKHAAYLRNRRNSKNPRKYFTIVGTPINV